MASCEVFQLVGITQDARERLCNQKIEGFCGELKVPPRLSPDIAASLGATLFSGVVIEGHQRVGYLKCCCLPAGLREMVKYPRWRWRVIVLESRWLGLTSLFNPTEAF